MRQLFLDSTSICQYFGNPHLFITFTCNSQGLPHVHILSWLDPINMITEVDHIDSIISAELPDPEIDPLGYETVTKFMLHGPCGAANLNSPCMKNGVCSKGFPKAFCSTTTTDQFGYVVYRRRDLGITATKGGTVLDNRYVVPFNRNLLVLFQAHINVELCHQGRVIKYLFKYLTKGPDRHQKLRNIMARPNVGETTLTRWFKLNERDPKARELTYDEIPNKYVWKEDSKDWFPCKKGFAIGRIAYIHPGANDTFYLRQLLTKVRGALSFVHLRTVNGTVCRSFKVACQKLGLLANDDEWLLVMNEVGQWGMCSLLRAVTSKLRSQRHIVLVVASSGIAATLLPDAITAHSRFKIPLEIDQTSTCMVKKGTALADLLSQASLIIWDEAPMVHRMSFEAVDRTLCDIMDIPLSGIGYKPFADSKRMHELETLYPTEFLNSLSFNGIPEHVVTLKVFTPIMLLRNLNPSIGLCNGTRIMTTFLGDYVIKGVIIGGSFEGSTVAIPRVILNINDSRWPFILKRRQFPIRLCYGMTINKSQGQTLERVGIYLPKPVFSHGQLYVAISRVKSASGLRILLLNDPSIPHGYTRNIVYTETFKGIEAPFTEPST
ncbi:ATP-dependent DNA helicase PIF1 [Linum perenne]